LAALSHSSFFLIAYEALVPAAQARSSSARHSEIDLMFLNEASLAPVVIR